MDEILEEVGAITREALCAGVQHGVSLAIAAVEFAAAQPQPPTLDELLVKLKNLEAALR